MWKFSTYWEKDDKWYDEVAKIYDKDKSINKIVKKEK